tara:strand:+ start:582 stop:803 length:222 start_codon:yes stop_codon:yes gene_type:complete
VILSIALLIMKPINSEENTQFIVVWKDKDGNERKFSTYANGAAMALNDALEIVPEIKGNPSRIIKVIDLSKDS